MRRLAAIALCLLALPSTAAAADRSWAEPQIETVVEAGLLADSAEAFKPQKPLTQRALGAALETLSLASAEPVAYRYPVAVPGRAVTIRELDAALVGFLGLGDSARLVTARSATQGSRRRRAPARRRSPACSGSASTTPPPRRRSSSASTTSRRGRRPRTRLRACSRSRAGSRSRSGRRPSSSSSPC